MHIAIVGQVRIYREGVAQLLKSGQNIIVTEVIGSEHEIIKSCMRNSVDVVLIDANIPNYLNLAKQIISELEIKIVGLALAENEKEIIACAETGFSGYVTRDANCEEMMEVIRSSIKGEFSCSPKIAGTFLRHIHNLAANNQEDHDTPHITNREIQIVQLIDQGLSNKDIARELHIEVSTVKNHVHNLLDKLHVRRRGEAVARLRYMLPRSQPYSQPSH